MFKSMRWLVTGLIILIANASWSEEAKPKVLEIELRSFKVKDSLPRMVGPTDFKVHDFLPGAKAIWVVGAEINGYIDGKPSDKAKEFLCHSAVSLPFSKDEAAFYAQFAKKHSGASSDHESHHDSQPMQHMHNQSSYQHATTMGDLISKRVLFPLSVNQPKILLPPGFGIPVTGSKLVFTATLTNLIPEPKPINLQFRFKLYYYDDPEVIDKLNAVKMRSAAVTIAPNTGADEPVHWVLKPNESKQISTDITKIVESMEGNKIVYIGSHMHPGVQALEFFNGAKKQSLFRSEVTYSGQTKENMDSTFFSGTQSKSPILPILPILIDKRDKYSLEVRSSNPYGQTIGVMAVAYFYVAK